MSAFDPLRTLAADGKKVRMGRYLLIASLLLWASPGLACSPDGKYRVPTNVELLQKADLVVLATVVTGPRTPEEAWSANGEPRVVLRPSRVLKGTSPRELRVEGILSDQRGRPYPFTPTQLSAVHPSALEGACIRERYRRGALVLAMFRRTPTGYVQLEDVFARSVEDVQGPAALWPRAAELYLGLLSIKDRATRRSAFLHEQQRLAAAGSRDDKAIAADIGRYLKATRN